MSSRVPRDQVVTWGRGGPDHTVKGLTRAEADELMRDVRAWGPVRLVCGSDGVTRWATTGNPVPGDIARDVASARTNQELEREAGRRYARAGALRRSGRNRS
jgi:hypothetical protein